MDVWMHGRVDGWLDAWMHECMDGWTDGVEGMGSDGMVWEGMM